MALTRTVEVTRLSIQITDEAEDKQGGGLVFAGAFRDVNLPENCTIRQAIEALERLEELLKPSSPQDTVTVVT